MKKLSVYAIAILGLIACGGNSEDTSASLIAFDQVDKSAAKNTEVKKGPLKSKTSIEYFETKHDFGNVFYPSDNVYTFKFKNTGSEPLTIFNAKASCGCTVPNKPEEPIMPGEIGEMDVVFKPKEGQAGTQVTKKITVTANTEPSQTYLEITANVIKGLQ